MNFLHVQMICIADLYDCVNSYTVIILYVSMPLYVLDMFHILLSGDSLTDLWSVYMYVCLHFTKLLHFGSRDSSVGIATRYGLHGPGIESR